jgi:hypothetical protein
MRGMLKKKMLRQLTYWVNIPPIAGPTIKKRALMPVLMPIALALSPSAKVDIKREVMAGIMRAPPPPWIARPTIILHFSTLQPATRDPSPKKSIPQIKAARIPHTSLSRPPISKREVRLSK